MAQKQPTITIKVEYIKLGVIVAVQGGKTSLVDYGNRPVCKSDQTLIERTDLLERFNERPVK